MAGDELPAMSDGFAAWFNAAHDITDALTMTSTSQTSNRRRITPLEGRKLALDILHRAEAGKAAAAEAESRQGIDWEEAS